MTYDQMELIFNVIKRGSAVRLRLINGDDVVGTVSFPFQINAPMSPQPAHSQVVCLDGRLYIPVSSIIAIEGPVEYEGRP